MQLQHNVSLKPYNTMQLDAQAAFFVEPGSLGEVQSLKDLPELYQHTPFILGDGSNTLLSKNLDCLVIHPQLKGREAVDETENSITLKLGASESWHEFVTWAVDHNWGGVENLALIPGTVGAAPVQNIAAYGQAQSNTFVELEAVELKTGQTKNFLPKQMQFAYRDSLFKHLEPASHLVTSVKYCLKKNADINTSYYSIGRRRDSIAQELEKLGQPPYSIKDTFQAVSNIRTCKLPDWHATPTFGSFFKNPLVTKPKLAQLQQTIEDLQFYPADNLTYQQLNDPAFDQSDYVKIPVGRLLDFLGWADRPLGHVHTYNHWASIITHDGQATGSDVLHYINAMRKDVYDTFGIELEHEVVVL